MIVVTAACRGCGACLLTCPQRAIRPAGHAPGGAAPLTVLPQRCTGCAECIEICPADAIDFSSGPVGAGRWVKQRGRP
jgi:NAD-dependent dihydropyrimidine dehydrogenase PreA subunit